MIAGVGHAKGAQCHAPASTLGLRPACFIVEDAECDNAEVQLTLRYRAESGLCSGCGICDLERCRPIALLPGRELAMARALLAGQPPIAVVARDRGGPTVHRCEGQAAQKPAWTL